MAKNSQIRFEGLGGTEGGVIGAIAGVGLASLKNDGRFLLKGKNRELSGIKSISEIINAGIDEVLTLQGKTINEGKCRFQKTQRPLLFRAKPCFLWSPTKIIGLHLRGLKVAVQV